MTGQRTRSQMRRFPCRTCGAKPGEPCRTLRSKITTNYHQSRWEPEYGGDFEDSDAVPPPRCYSFTRDQLIEALVRLEVHVANSGPLAGKVIADSMADAIIRALEGTDD